MTGLGYTLFYLSLVFHASMGFNPFESSDRRPRFFGTRPQRKTIFDVLSGVDPLEERKALLASRGGGVSFREKNFLGEPPSTFESPVQNEISHSSDEIEKDFEKRPTTPKKRVIVDPSRLIQCPNQEGSFPLPDEMDNVHDIPSVVQPRKCSDQFLMCKFLEVGMRGFIFRCPEGFVFSTTGARCQMKENVPECSTRDEVDSVFYNDEEDFYEIRQNERNKRKIRKFSYFL